MAEISDRAKSIIGHETRYTLNGKVITGIVDGVRQSGGVVRNIETGEEWPGIQFLINGRWSTTFPDCDPDDVHPEGP